MTDKGLLLRGYRQLHPNHEPNCMWTLVGADKFFEKRFLDDEGNSKYVILVRKYDPYFVDGEMAETKYECSVVMSQAEDIEKRVCMNFCNAWGVDEVEQFVEFLCQKTILKPVV